MRGLTMMTNATTMKTKTMVAAAPFTWAKNPNRSICWNNTTTNRRKISSRAVVVGAVVIDPFQQSNTWFGRSSYATITIQQRSIQETSFVRFASSTSSSSSSSESSWGGTNDGSSSTSKQSSMSSSPPPTSILKSLIKPFILKCHPDMAQQQGLAKPAQRVNLLAIQNLNSYIDGVNQYYRTGKYPFSVPPPSSSSSSSSLDNLIEIEFVMALSSIRNHPTSTTPSATVPITAAAGGGGGGRYSNPTTSRRKVELQVPPPTMTPSRAVHYVQRQVVKLLRMADLPVPPLELLHDHDEYYYDNNDHEDDTHTSDSHEQQQRRRRGFSRGVMTPWEISRERFWTSINWTKFNVLYDDAVRDARAHIVTKNMVRDSPKLRQQLLGKILSNIRFDNTIEPLDRLVLYRRFLRILDRHFDELYLEDFGRYWEDKLSIHIVPARQYNTSSSAMKKRRERNQETGYSFTVHHDDTVSIQVPVDFDDGELIQELRRNITDYVEWTRQEAVGLEDLGLFTTS